MNVSERKDLPFNFSEGEVLLVDKPLEWTSFDVVNKLKYTLKPLKIKIGHAGTLDPLATGLLIICTGKKTKIIDEFQAQEKEYTGTITLGATTPSYDLETIPENFIDYQHLKDADLVSACQQFVGEIDQFPPPHSAIKQNGERLYEKARRGEVVELKSRKVTIKVFELTRIALPEIDFRVVCSKGTYIRSLANDFGKALDNAAYLSGLRRTRSGDFNVHDAYKLEDLIQHINFEKESQQVRQEPK